MPLEDEADIAIAAINGEPASAPETDSDLWAAIADETDSNDDDSVSADDATPESLIPPVPVSPATEPAPEPAIEEPVQPAPVPEEPAAITPPPVEPAQSPQPVQPVPQEPVQPAPSAPTKTPEQLNTERIEARNTALAEIAKSYAMSDDEAAEVITDPQKVLPQMGARIFLDTFDAVTKAVMQALPNLIDQQTQVNEQQRTAEDAFYEANPGLDRKAHGKIVNVYAQTYMQVNPQATLEDMIRDVGVQVMYRFGIDPRPAAPTPTPTPTPATVVPHQPAGVGGGGAEMRAASGQNIWGDIAEQLLTDEDA